MTNSYYYQHARRDQNKIAITFDDGPNPHFTGKVIEILNSRKVRGTFFMIGSQVEAEPTLAAEVHAAGHVIGNHTYSHAKSWENHGTAFWQADIEHGELAIQQVIQQPTAFFRLPYGSFTPDVSAVLRQWLGARRILNGDVSADDWRHLLESPLPPQRIIDTIFNTPTLANGSVIVFHDGSELAPQRPWRSEPMLRALPIVLDTLLDRGYQLVGADELEFDLSGAVPLAD
jgi:peptidoglycan/xylan/chitin deacetylase (PgdA/CDA1 family)